MEKKIIEEMARDLSETYKGNDCLFTNACDICEYRKYQGNKEYPCGAMKHAKEMIVRGYRKERQGECEYCKTGNEKCGTCAYFIGIDTNDALDRCSEYYGENKCVKYKPASYCFNCRAKMKGE